jgi:predicted NAD/FAD-binding protein
VPDAQGVTVTSGAGREHFAAAVIAVGPHQLASALGDGGAMAPWRSILARVAAFAYESITTVYLGFAGLVLFAAPVIRRLALAVTKD